MDDNKPLYCFKLNEETGEIVRYTIKEYKLTRTGSRESYWFKDDIGNGDNPYSFGVNHLGSIYHNKLYTFSGLFSEAVPVFLQYFEENRDSAVDEYRKYNRLIRYMKEHYLGAEVDDGEQI